MANPGKKAEEPIVNAAVAAAAVPTSPAKKEESPTIVTKADPKGGQDTAKAMCQSENRESVDVGSREGA